MLIDWFTVAAQALNFLILVWLLKRFLYQPVLAAIAAREKKIAATLADAAAKETQAQAARADFQQRNEAFDREREALLRKATAEAAVERQRLLEAARQDSELLRSKLTKSLADERAALNQRLITQTQAEVLALARGALTDLAGVELEARMTDVFITHLRDLPPEQRHPPTATALIRSAFEIAASGRTAIEAAVKKCLGAEVTLQFETVPDLVCGIELKVDGVKLAWSVADYLASIATNLATLVASTPVPVAPTPTPAASQATEPQHVN